MHMASLILVIICSDNSFNNEHISVTFEHSQIIIQENAYENYSLQNIDHFVQMPMY